MYVCIRLTRKITSSGAALDSQDKQPHTWLTLYSFFRFASGIWRLEKWFSRFELSRDKNDKLTFFYLVPIYKIHNHISMCFFPFLLQICVWDLENGEMVSTFRTVTGHTWQTDFTFFLLVPF